MGRQEWYGYNRGGPRSWMRFLLPLIVGIGLGALLFGGGPRWGAFGNTGYGTQAQRYEQLEQRSTESDRAPGSQRQAESARQAEQFGYERGYDGPRGGYGHRGFGWGPFGFGGFGIGRLLLPLLLIGGGLWLLNRRRGPGAPGGPPQGGQPAGPAPEPPSYGPGDAPNDHVTRA